MRLGREGKDSLPSFCYYSPVLGRGFHTRPLSPRG
jgi:hypothetical protein